MIPEPSLSGGGGGATTSFDIETARNEFTRRLTPDEAKLYYDTTSAADCLARFEEDVVAQKAMKRLVLAVRAVEGYEKALEVIRGLDMERVDELWGAVVVIVKAAAGTDFMLKLSSHIASIADNLSRLVLYGRILSTSRAFQHAAALTYVLTFEFCSAARAVFMPEETEKDKCRGLEARWAEFEDRFPDMVDGMRLALEMIERDEIEEKQERDDSVGPLRGEDNRSDRSGGECDRSDEGADTEREHVLDWLLKNTGHPAMHHQAAVKLHYPGTGEWLLQSTEYVEWLRTQHGILWLHGIPGSGKTVLCSTVIEDITQKLGPNGSGVAYFYCLTGATLLGAAQILRNIIAQLCSQSEQFFTEVRAFYRRLEPQSLSVADAINILQTNAWHFTKIAIIVDALDESPDIEETILALVQLIDRQSGNISLFLTSRHDADIQQLMSKHAQFEAPMSKTGVQKDINAYVSAQLQTRVADHQLKLRDPTLSETIRQALVDGADGMFLWAVCQIESICRQRNDKSIRTALGKLPRDLDQTYTRVLEEIRVLGPEQKKLARRILRWLVYCREPLSPDELTELVAVEPQDSVLDGSSVHTDPSDLLDICRSLIRIVSDESGCERVELVHCTLQEFLTSDRIQHSTISEFYLDPVESHQTLATICLRYLGFTDFSSRCKNDPELNRRLSYFKALNYVADHWHYHVSKCDQNTITPLIPALNWFLAQREDNYSSWLQAYYKSSTTFAENTPPLYYTVSFQLYTLTCYLLDRGDSPNARINYGEGECALHVAASANDLPTIQALLGKGADIEVRAWNREQAALHYAAEAGHWEAVNLLLDMGAEVDSRSHSQSTPLYRAARGGDIRTVMELLKRGADVNAKTWDGFTPAHEAARSGDSEVWKALVAAGADMEATTSTGQKPGDVATAVMQPLLEETKDFECAHPGCKLVFPSKSEKAAHEQTTHLSQLPNYSLLALGPSTNSVPASSGGAPLHALPPSIAVSKGPVRSASTASKNANRHRPTASAPPIPPPVKHGESIQPYASLPRPTTQYFWCSAASCTSLFDSMASRDHHETTAHAGMTVTFKHQPNSLSSSSSSRALSMARSSTSKSAPAGTGYKRNLSDDRLSSAASAYAKNRTNAVVGHRFSSSSPTSGLKSRNSPTAATAPSPNAAGKPETMEICGIVGCVQRFSGIGELMRHEVSAHKEALRDLENECEGVEGDGMKFGGAASVVYSCRSTTCNKRFQLAASRMWHELFTHPNEDVVKRPEREAHIKHYGNDKVWTEAYDEWKKTKNTGA
ncbi:hypothetical protein EX30DRAFT_344379 [Ascodesmis nigricans]|uniref:C2H2-type domain-containing protein n=1 Tax=Ascodesmis nigricans TaxID=341454 RepID=A0A4S2MJV7_9PEZI|nr:hypothetical protein EX30DRAFT_344379 [Ascodesmis nigricans]